MSIRVGIDLGTTFSTVAYINEQTGRPQIIKNRYDSTVTPSVLCFQPDGSILYGEDAKEEQSIGNLNCAAFFKRNMGNPSFTAVFNGKTYTPTDLSSIFLKKLKEEAEQQIGKKIDSAVITVPAYFRHQERSATIEAGERAGLHVLTLLNEPTAAAFAYGLVDNSVSQTILVYDLGGGTFDVTIAKVTRDAIQILGSDGNHSLGGRDWDDCLAQYLIDTFMEQTGVDISDDSESSAALLVTAETVKKKLTSQDKVTVPINFHGTKATIEITNNLFEDISSYLLGTTKTLTEELINSLKLTWKDIDGVILVGGSTRMRMIRSYVTEMSGKPPLSGVNVDEAVALGAAIRANIDDRGQTLTLGGKIKSSDSELPKIAGAKAITDVTAHSLGMISINSDRTKYINSIILHKNSKIPAAGTKPYTLRTRAQGNELEVYVIQGELERPLDNSILAKYLVTGITDVPNHKSIIDVTVAYTENGVAEVKAVQKENGKILPIKIDPVPDDMGWTDLPPEDEVVETVRIPSVEIILIVDLSYSMVGSPLIEAKAAMTKFVDQVSDVNASIGIIIFALSNKCLLKPTKDYAVVKRSIDSLEVEMDGIGPGTCANPFPMAQEILSGGLFKQKSDIRYVVVLTDGQWAYEDKAISSAKKCHKSGIEIMALGFGEAEYRFLRQIASTDEFASITNLTEISGSFSKIAQVIETGASGLSLNKKGVK